MFKYKRQKNKGFYLLELLFYISLFILLSLVVINSMITMVRSLVVVNINNELAQSYQIIENIFETARDSRLVDVDENDDLILTREVSSILKEYKYELSGTDLRLYEDAVLLGNLNALNINVISFDNEVINTGRATAVKTTLVVSHKKDPQARNITFYNTTILKDSY